MKQVCMSNGQIAVVEVPPPICGPGQVLVRTSHSLISTGTELAMTGGGAAESLVRKALNNPQLVQKVWEKVTTVGVKQTIDLVRARTSGSLPLGYSAAGRVVEVGSAVTRFRRGDRVACAGAGYANHAEYNAVPENLVARIPDPVAYVDAAFATLGAIALQGVRRLEPTLGEQIVVVGLGLIGQITVQLLKRSGCRVFGVDLMEERIALARQFGLEDGIAPGERDLARVVGEWSSGVGADGVIICASAGDIALLNRSFDLCRRKGRVVLVGDVPIRIARDRIYRKELDFRISCSYGPGRYDPAYEERGEDYPIGYVRWTEGRNLSEVLRLLGTGELVVSSLIGEVFSSEEAPRAYQTLQASKAVAAVLDYALPPEAADLPPVRAQAIPRGPQAGGTGTIRLGVIGTGTFFRAVHLPNLEKTGGFTIAAAASRTGLQLRDLAAKHGIARIATDAQDALRDPDIEAVLIATRHDLHAEYVLAALEAGKHVFVEKPMAMTAADCERIVAAAEASGRLVMVGFNRRFSPHAREAKKRLDAVREPKTVVYRVNAGSLPADHWLRDAREGGGRLVGEGVHFFDFVRWLIGADPVSVSATAVMREGPDPDNSAVTIGFADGSCGVVVYNSQGHPAAGKERVEMFGGGQVLVIDDFAALELHGLPVKSAKKGLVQKGHLEILTNFAAAIRGREPAGVSAVDGYWATWCAERALRALQSA